MSELVLDTLRALSGELNFLASGDEKPAPGTQFDMDTECLVTDVVNSSSVRQVQLLVI